eukprot:927712-Amphidinium_carterae.1
MTKYHGRNLLLNWNKLKSEIMFTLPAQETAAFHATLNMEAKRRNWEHPAIIVKNFQIRVIRSYVYLGRRVVDNGSTNQHARERAAVMTATIHSFRRIYNCSRATLHKAVRRRPITRPTCQLGKLVLARSVWQHTMAGASFAHLSEQQILDRVSKPSWEVHGDALRLRFAIRLARCTCPVVRASMACVGMTKGSWWLAFASAANRLREAVPQARGMPEMTEASIGVWMQVIALDASMWKKWIKTYIKSDIDNRRHAVLQNPEDAPREDVGDQLGDVYPCFFCGKEFNTFRGMLSHRRQSHKSDSGLSARVKDTTCISCDAQFETRQAHLAHLVGNLRCALYTMTTCSRLTEAELSAARKVKVFLRTAPPQKGPKRLIGVDQRPTTRTIPLLDLDIDDISAEG